LFRSREDSCEGIIRYDTRPASILGAPSKLLSLSITDGSTRRWQCPQTEIVTVVHPHCLAHRGLGGLSTAIVGARLTDLRLLGELFVYVARIPTLVRVFAIAVPKLDLVAIDELSIRKVHALLALDPFNAIFAPWSVLKLLVLVNAVGRAVPDLELHTVYIVAVDDIETLGTIIKSHKAAIPSPGRCRR